ncbi:4-hydroxy-tetrahydrodipicolinate reductase [Pelagicoccus sp. NFK12]|uniref:4-hydroxy-tetrahydrodipicolinate reductase n=1 Tax=Pelagicoccus enzymogenes TaxID=2773457 RepID=A0A927FAX8_9BACT|nr:4-hydroxy-tetrahydrodipicolinate reductase [Pelagicoccus enzymogenes]MBD5780380.1 4-hydroxy-tetrahydrodipicolinate reductase [Pelagicoccus enzymogenes]MDQ8197717.1 4-hydroxy-tetrahydrodipicolinate reductase [Pelagicoccus enzymogenes]
MSLKICIVGAKGRMGQAIAEATEEAGHTVAAKVDQGDDLRAGIEAADAVIDFSYHTVTESVFRTAAELGKPVVCGTTGHSQEERAKLLEIAAQTPTVWAGNFSIGVNLLCYLVEKAADILPLDYNAEIVEMHHRLKKDAPSGTALMLADSVLEPRGLNHDDLRHGREGITGERTQREVGMHSLRGGDVVGDHTVIFSDVGERVELTHKASSRAIFARGAVRAAAWSVGKEPGIYGIREVLGLA